LDAEVAQGFVEELVEFVRGDAEPSGFHGLLTGNRAQPAELFGFKQAGGQGGKVAHIGALHAAFLEVSRRRCRC
jgi:hypothetical protein